MKLIASLSLVLLIAVVAQAQPVQPTEFVPIGGPAPAGQEYAPGLPGWILQQNFYPDGNIIHGTGNPASPLNNYNIHVNGTGDPPNSVFDATQASPTINYGNGGAIAGGIGFPDGDGDDFSLRANAFVEFPSAGTYTVQHGADDTTYIVVDTGDGTPDVFSRDCCGNTTDSLTITAPGIYPVDFVFGENGGGAWTDLEFRDASGNVLNTFQLELVNAVPEPASVAIWSLLGLGLVGFGVYRVRKKK